MKKASLFRLVILFVTTITMAGCVVAPLGWDDGGHYDRGYHRGGYDDGGHYRMGGRGGDDDYAYNRGDRH